MKRRDALVLVVLAAGLAAAEEPPRLLWHRTWDSPGHGPDVAWGVAVAPRADRIYVSGWTIRKDLDQGYNGWLGAWDAAGAFLWEREWDSPAHRDDEWHGAACDAAGNVYVTGAEFRPDLKQGNNLVVAKYAPDGRLLWSDTYDGAGSEDYGIDVKVDARGRLYVLGYEDRTDRGQDWNIWLRQYDARGRAAWTRTWDSPAHGRDEGQALGLDARDGVWASGWTRRDDLGEGYNAWVARYAADGTCRWQRAWDAGAGEDNVALAAAGAPDGTGYAVGWEDRPDLGQKYNAWIAKFTPAGATLWTDALDSPAHAYDYFHQVVTDAAGRPYACGYTDRPDLGHDTDAWVQAWEADGRRRWALTEDSPAHKAEIAWALALDGRGHLYVAGSEQRPDLHQAEDVFLSKYALSATLSAR